jgi:hypothetical protein
LVQQPYCMGQVFIFIIYSFFSNFSDRIKGQLRDSGVKGSIVSAGWKADRTERINELRKYAIEKRRKRMLKILNDAVELGDSTVITKLSEYEENSS